MISKQSRLHGAVTVIPCSTQTQKDKNCSYPLSTVEFTFRPEANLKVVISISVWVLFNESNLLRNAPFIMERSVMKSPPFYREHSLNFGPEKARKKPCPIGSFCRGFHIIFFDVKTRRPVAFMAIFLLFKA